MVNPAQPLNQYFLVGGNAWTDYGVPGVEAFIEAGHVVVATDYQGLGGGGVHQYAVAATQARDAINAIRAVGAMGVAGDNKKAVIYGWSQGGGATIAAASLTEYLSRTGTALTASRWSGSSRWLRRMSRSSCRTVATPTRTLLRSWAPSTAASSISPISP
jgi:dipeptidyl aminopeptidase/acylaminoacyl peptidase